MSVYPLDLRRKVLVVVDRDIPRREVAGISDRRMSGMTAQETVPHAAPGATVGGIMALVRTGDEITMDVEARSLELFADEEKSTRRAARKLPESAECGYLRPHQERRPQADEDRDLDPSKKY